MELGKQAVEVHKQVLESLKTPSEIAKNLGVADYYQAGARLHDYHRSAQYVTDQVMIHAAGPLAQAQAQKEIMDYKEVLETKGAEALIGRKAPPMLVQMTGMTDMGEIAKYFGRNNLAHMLQIAEQMQARLATVNANRSNQEFTKLYGSYVSTEKAIAIMEEKLKNAIPLDKWNAMTPGQQQTAKFNGGFPRTPELDNELNRMRIMQDNLGVRLYGKDYQPLPKLPVAGPIINVTPPGAAPGAAPPGHTPTGGWAADFVKKYFPMHSGTPMRSPTDSAKYLYNAVTKPIESAADKEALDRLRELEEQNMWQ